ASSSYKAYGFEDGNTVGNDYDYDTNGNMTEDKNKGIISISYNHLNLPDEVQFGGTDKIKYIYDATGVKLEKKVTENGSDTYTHYAGNYVYRDTGSGSSLKFFNHPEGYVEPEDANNYSQGFNYAYQYRDHLGNIRLSYMDINGDNLVDGTGSTSYNDEILEENNYYPFGLRHKGYNNNPVTNHPFKYSGKELNEELELDWYDFGARNYDVALGRWMNPDPLAEKYYGASPYNYALNNPTLFIDPDGKDVIISIDEDGNITISGNIYIHGSGANDKEASKIEKSIENYWNAAGLGYKDEDGNEYSVKFDVNVEVYDEETTELKEGDNLVEIKDEEGRSYVDGVRSNGGTWYSKESSPGANYFTYAHEFGHLAGLKDRYSDNSEGYSEPNDGWENNIMGDWAGNVEQRNIDGIVEGAVNTFNRFKSAYSNYQARKNTTRYRNAKRKNLFNNYTRTGTFKTIKKPVLVKLTGN
ncbi:RHS repeat-associated core domain-containing protein, partial [Flavisericum labens]|uniref:RHS repeat-associated core domain-containing protein n=1 Tax=Flavisericum labens TaxID=3377112 RepID=UPI00387AEC51